VCLNAADRLPRCVQTEKAMNRSRTKSKHIKTLKQQALAKKKNRRRV
jgi:hypothetical protein